MFFCFFTDQRPKIPCCRKDGPCSLRNGKGRDVMINPLYYVEHISYGTNESPCVFSYLLTRWKWTISMTFKISPVLWRWPRPTPLLSLSLTQSTTSASRRLVTTTRLTCESVRCVCHFECHISLSLTSLEVHHKLRSLPGGPPFLETGKLTQALLCWSRWPCQTSKNAWLNGTKIQTVCLAARITESQLNTWLQVQIVGGFMRRHLWRVRHLCCGGSTR